MRDVRKKDIQSLGEIKIQCNHKKGKYQLVFQVVDFYQMPLLSEKSCSTLGLIKYCKLIKTDIPWIDKGREEAKRIMHNFEDVFTGHGEFPDIDQLEVHENVKPVIAKPRKIPHAYRKNLKKALD